MKQICLTCKYIWYTNIFLYENIEVIPSQEHQRNNHPSLVQYPESVTTYCLQELCCFSCKLVYCNNIYEQY